MVDFNEETLPVYCMQLKLIISSTILAAAENGIYYSEDHFYVAWFQ